MNNIFLTRPLTTRLNATNYEWAGTALQRLFNSSAPIAEVWAFFSGPQKPAVIAMDGGTPITMEQLITTAPETLGPRGADSENHNQKFFFVKFLDPSDFPPFAYVGFNPEVTAPLGLEGELFTKYFADLLWQDREALEAFATLVRPRIASVETFDRLKTAFKRWSIEQARHDWHADLNAAPLLECVPAEGRQAGERHLELMQRVRRHALHFMHRIDYEDDQAILIETPTLHAIAGLSLQIHPRRPGNFFPKDELWIYKPLYDARGERLGWVLVEPQRTFDKTESCADFFTPFAWTTQGLGFRKTITREYLETFVAMMDARAYPREHYVRRATAVTLPEARVEGGAQWYRTVEEPAWPYFLVRELRFSGAGRSVTPLPHHSFIELHATQGTIQIALQHSGRPPLACALTPQQPLFLPATLPYDTIEYRAEAPAQLLFFTRHA